MPGQPGRLAGRRGAATLFEGLLQRVFDPFHGHGGGTSARVVHVFERRYYNLLKRFAHKAGARYEVDAGVLELVRRSPHQPPPENGPLRRTSC